MQTALPGFAEMILSSLSSGIVAIDRAGLVVTLNEGAQRILGCPEGSLRAALGRSCREVLGAQPAVVRLLIETLDGRRPLSRAEALLDAVPGGRASTIGFTLCPIRDGRGPVRGAAMIFRDLTPFERADEQARLRERLAALGQMAAGLAHEIRNPLAGMEVIAGLLSRRAEGRPEEQMLVAELTGELRSLADTVTDCLDFVRPLALVRGPVDLIELLEASLTVAQSRVGFGGTIERRYAESLPEIVADGDRLRAVVVNLIVNAFEAMAEGGGNGGHRLALGLRDHVVDGGGIPVRVGADGDATAPEDGPAREVVISVSDTGPGIPAELREKVFYPFFTTKQRGSGVGLANAQKIAVSHGGTIEVDTGEEGGCTFRMHLPVSAGKAAEPPRSEPQASEVQGQASEVQGRAGEIGAEP
jgi:signal transduction histidine kinase